MVKHFRQMGCARPFAAVLYCVLQKDVLTSHRECDGIGNKAILLQFFRKAGLTIAFTFFLTHFNTSLRCSNHQNVFIHCSIIIYARVLGDFLRVYFDGVPQQNTSVIALNTLNFKDKRLQLVAKWSYKVSLVMMFSAISFWRNYFAKTVPYGKWEHHSETHSTYIILHVTWNWKDRWVYCRRMNNANIEYFSLYFVTIGLKGHTKPFRKFQWLLFQNVIMLIISEAFAISEPLISNSRIVTFHMFWALRLAILNI